MSSTPQPIRVAIGSSATDLYTAFVGGGATRAQLVSLNLSNTTASAITVDVWYRNAGDTTSTYLIQALSVSAHSTKEWRGLVVFNTTGEKLRAQGSATGVDCLGSIIENVYGPPSPGTSHDPLTLATAAEAVFGLSAQVLDFDATQANKVLAGPTSGGDAKPAMRLLVAADIPGGAAGAGSQGPPGLDGVAGEDAFPIPGSPGAAGTPGSPGSPGAAGADGRMGMPGFDGADGMDGFPIPGSIGPQGVQGVQGVQGIPGIALDGEPGQDAFPIPGVDGRPGTDGTSGPVGPQGIPGIGIDGADGMDGTPIPGPQGIAGSVGAKGDTGNTGAAGGAGPLGPPGFDGDAGLDGFPTLGPIGPQGVQGVQGIQGIGLDGADGVDGLPIPGTAGAQGPAGADGAVGSQGSVGSQGIPGIGMDGIDGQDGFPVLGKPGTDGASGPVGPQGIPGIGIDGGPGEDSWFGPTGAMGIPGPAGVQGIPGISIDGRDGEDAFPIPGPAGVAGTLGATGAAGPIGLGIPGVDGEDGYDGFPVAGAAGAAGAPGASIIGPMGMPGFDGADGLDGFAIPGPAGPAGGGGSGIALWDADADTGIQVEESADEDKIRFDTGGVERLLLDSSGLYSYNHLGVGADATAVPGADKIVTVIEVMTVASTKYGLYLDQAYAGTKASNIQYGGYVFSRYQGVAAGSCILLAGLGFEACYESAQTLTAAYGFYGRLVSAAAGSGTWTTGTAYYGYAGYTGSKPATVYGLRLMASLGSAGVATAYGIRCDDFAATTSYLVELGPATPYFRVIGGANPAANQTNVYMNEGGTLRQVQWKNPDATGHLAAADKVLVLI